MINKQNLWFITLFSLVLVLGIYYISLPNDDALALKDTDNSSTAVEIMENDVIVALKVEAEEQMLSEMEEAQKVLLDSGSTVSDKNEAYDKLQNLNRKKGKIEEIEKRIKEKFSKDSCVTIEGNKINITISDKDKGTSYANNIIKEVQSLYTEDMYITVKFSG